jgi:hypothetical protein
LGNFIILHEELRLFQLFAYSILDTSDILYKNSGQMSRNSRLYMLKAYGASLMPPVGGAL